MLDETLPNREGAEPASADPNLTRKVFLSKVVKGAALTGGLAMAPKVLDKFLVQSVAACTPPSSGCVTTSGATVASPTTDTLASAPCSDTGFFPSPFGDTVFTAPGVGGGDTLNCCGDNGTVLGGTGGGSDTLDCKTAG